MHCTESLHFLCFLYFFFFFLLYFFFFFFFFFQAEDGIRDGRVTGVQTCALPISYKGTTIYLILLSFRFWIISLVVTPVRTGFNNARSIIPLVSNIVDRKSVV